MNPRLYTPPTSTLYPRRSLSRIRHSALVHSWPLLATPALVQNALGLPLALVTHLTPLLHIGINLLYSSHFGCHKTRFQYKYPASIGLRQSAYLRAAGEEIVSLTSDLDFFHHFRSSENGSVFVQILNGRLEKRECKNALERSHARAIRS